MINPFRSALGKRWLPACIALAMCPFLPSDASAVAADLKDAASPDAYLVAWGTHNPERDYLRQHYADVWKTIQETRVVERVVQLVQSRIGEADAQQFIQVRDAITQATAPIDFDKLGKTSEVLYVQEMDFPTTRQLLMLRIPEGGAAGLNEAFANLFRLAEQAAGGSVSVSSETIEGCAVTFLRLPEQVPIQPLVGVKDDVFLFATSGELARQCLGLLAKPDAVSKFDDPRVVEALSQLPPAEDSITVFDAEALMSQLHGMGEFIRTASKGNEKAVRVAAFAEKLTEQMRLVDLEVAVEYTEGFQNRQASFGRVRADAGDIVLRQMVSGQQPFGEWQKWVPENVAGFSLQTGVSLQPLYAWLMRELPASFPELQPGLDRFAELQKQYDLYLDEDLLQAFTGETASLTFPGATPTPFGKSSESVLFVRCTKPDRVRELLHRGMNALEEIPQVRAQGVGLKEAPGLEGFDELNANILAMVGVRPVIGFREGWMIIGSHAAAVQQALAAQTGTVSSFADTDRFRQFNVVVDGPVYAISYRNSGESIRQTSAGMQQAGIMLPMVIGMAAPPRADGRGPDLSVLQDIAALLPSIGKIIGKLDFYDQTFSVTRKGPADGTWMRDTVVLIRPPAAPELPESATTESKPANENGGK